MENIIIDLEKAMAILDYIKAESKEDSVLLDSVNIAESDHYSYTPLDHKLNLSDEPLNNAQDMFIIEYMNKEFDLDLKNNIFTRSVHAFLHELGHHMDFGKCTEDELHERMVDYFDYDHNVKLDTFINTQKMINILDEIENNISELKDDELDFDDFYMIMDQLAKQYNRTRKERIKIDEAYRKNPAEYAADSFAAKIFKEYLINIMPELFAGEHVIRKIK
jgi:hypothetical protein